MRVEGHDLETLRSRAKSLATRALRKRYGRDASTLWFVRHEVVILERREFKKPLASHVSYRTLLDGRYPHNKSVSASVDIDLLTRKGVGEVCRGTTR
jgi:hypothetical protein